MMAGGDGPPVPCLCFTHLAAPMQQEPEVVLGLMVVGIGCFPPPHFGLLYPSLLLQQNPEVVLGGVVAGVSGSPVPRLGLLDPSLLLRKDPEVALGAVVTGIGGLLKGLLRNVFVVVNVGGASNGEHIGRGQACTEEPPP